MTSVDSQTLRLSNSFFQANGLSTDNHHFIVMDVFSTSLCQAKRLDLCVLTRVAL